MSSLRLFASANSLTFSGYAFLDNVLVYLAYFPYMYAKLMALMIL